MLKPLSKKELQELIQNSDKVADDASDKTVLALRGFLTSYVKNFKAALADFSVSESEKISLAEQEALIGEITSLLQESGYSDVVDEFERSFQDVGIEAVKYFSEYYDNTIAFGGTSKQILNKMAEEFLDELDFQVNNKLLRPLEQRVRNSILASETREQVVSDITEVINNEGILRKDGKQFTQTNIQVLVQEAPRRFNQQVRNELGAQLGLLVYVYAGPDDKVTSEQCRFLLRTARHGAQGFWYKDEITTGLHPKLRENPLVARGHYGCRHEWIPVDEEGAKQLDASFRARGSSDEQ